MTGTTKDKADDLGQDVVKGDDCQPKDVLPQPPAPTDAKAKDPKQAPAIKQIIEKFAKVKIQEEKKITKATLRRLEIASVDDLKEKLSKLSIKAEEVTDLDLSNNKLVTWAQVMEIVSFFSPDSLTQLNLSGHTSLGERYPCDLPYEEVRKNHLAFKGISTIILNECNLDWTGLITLVREVLHSEIERIQVKYNDISSLGSSPLSPSHYDMTKVTFLDFSYNPLSGWGEVLKLGQLPVLDTLILRGCPIDKVTFREDKFGQPVDDGYSLIDQFRSLRRLSLAGTNINDWLSVLELTRLNNLVDMSFEWTPLLTDSEEGFMGVTNIMLALFGRFVRKLNGVTVDRNVLPWSESYLLTKIESGSFPWIEYPVVEAVILHKENKKFVDREGKDIVQSLKNF